MPMSKHSTSLVEGQTLQLKSQLQFSSNWAEFDMFSLLKPLKAFHEHWDSVQLREYVSNGSSYSSVCECVCSQQRITFKASRWLIPRRNSMLEDLPTEILVEIFKHMGWRDILASRQVSFRHLKMTLYVLMVLKSCKWLREISTARPLWAYLFNRLSIELMAPPLLERPINVYTGDELEQIVLRRISSEVRWASEQPPRTRSVPMDCDELKGARLLLEGGRWLLKSLRKHPSRVYAYDLDNPLSQKPKCIIDLQTGTHPQIWRMAADVDRNESDLTFNLCIVPSCYGNYDNLNSPTMALGDIHIYRLTLDGFGSEATLKAQKIKTLDKGLQVGSRIVSLQGRYLARCLRSSKPRYFCIEILDWVLSNSSTHSKSYIDLPSYNDVPVSILSYQKSSLLTLLC
jgi:hypothetical protein